ncbi:HlyD family secretion protein [Flavobacteriaceae bacterium]|nr:HlyD family secretion protein [Flavobacteriaceae bacterium]
MFKKNWKLISSIAIILIALIWYFTGSDKQSQLLTHQVQVKNFYSKVFISGELEAVNSTEIGGPKNLRKYGLNDVKILDLVEEGSVIEKGGYVGRLDPSQINDKILDYQLNLENAESKFIETKLDTTLSLKQERTAIKDLQYSIEETELELNQSIYEPPATIKKIEISLEKLRRQLVVAEENYEIKVDQAKAKMVQAGTEVAKINKKIDELQNLSKSFTIFSEEGGMLTYKKNWNGTKRKVGSSISPWDPTIATLPDLSAMQTKTYANEVDIRKIKKGLKVEIGFDAFPDVTVPGEVVEVANIGEKKRGSDVMVFSVIIKLLEVNDDIRPGMTTANQITTFEQKEVISIPLEAVYSNDSINYIYKKSGFGIKKQQVILGEFNNTETIISAGLNAGDIIFLNTPEDHTNDAISLLEQEQGSPIKS